LLLLVAVAVAVVTVELVVVALAGIVQVLAEIVLVEGLLLKHLLR
jgi:hypothetical protein